MFTKAIKNFSAQRSTGQNHPLALDADGLARLLGGVVEVRRGGQLQTALAQQLVAQLDVGAWTPARTGEFKEPTHMTSYEG